jgi:hypothetical protein
VHFGKRSSFAHFSSVADPNLNKLSVAAIAVAVVLSALAISTQKILLGDKKQ